MHELQRNAEESKCLRSDLKKAVICHEERDPERTEYNLHLKFQANKGIWYVERRTNG